MLRTILTAALVLGASGVATPDASYAQGRGDYSERYRPHRQPRHVTLARHVRINNADALPRWIPVSNTYGLDKVQIQLRRGYTFVDNIVVVYANRRETIPVRRWLNVRDPMLTVDVRPRGLLGIYVYNTPMRSARGAGWRSVRSATIDVIGVRARWR